MRLLRALRASVGGLQGPVRWPGILSTSSSSYSAHLPVSFSSSSSSSSSPSSSQRKNTKRQKAEKSKATWEEFQQKEKKDILVRLELSNFIEDMKNKLRDSEQPSDERRTAKRNLKSAFARIYSSLDDPELGGGDLPLPRVLTMDNFRWLKSSWMQGDQISYRSLTSVLERARAALKSRHNISVVPPNKFKKLIVVGDLHGDLPCFAEILEKEGLPSDDLAYVFNGDFVDRGTHSTEVLCCICMLLLQHPDKVFLNRGNHEDPFMNRAYGFYDELILKYGTGKGEELHHKADEVFSFLPLCTFVPEHRCFISHAGPPCTDDGEPASEVQVGRIQRYLRRRTVAARDVLKMEEERAKTNGTSEKEIQAQIDDSFLLEHMMWSDPSIRGSGVMRSEARGAGNEFGLDVVQKFLLQNNLHTFVRSHQCVPYGCEIVKLEDENLSMYTVFSSANYAGSGNDAAYLLFQHNEPECEVVTMYADEVDQHQQFSREGRTSLTRLDALRQANYKTHLGAIRAIFRILDTDSDGVLTEAELHKALQWAHEFNFGGLNERAESLFEHVTRSIAVSKRRAVDIEEFTRMFMQAELANSTKEPGLLPKAHEVRT